MHLAFLHQGPIMATKRGCQLHNPKQWINIPRKNIDLRSRDNSGVAQYGFFVQETSGEL